MAKTKSKTWPQFRREVLLLTAYLYLEIVARFPFYISSFYFFTALCNYLINRFALSLIAVSTEGKCLYLLIFVQIVRGKYLAGQVLAPEKGVRLRWGKA